jgi:transcriptional regulator with GAF, ATPase, and Fis domain
VPVLLALFGPKRGVRLEIDARAMLGRSSEADLQLIDGKVSREHCRFTARGGSLEVEDLGSHNGTFVNGERLSAPRVLAPGDEIAVGDSLFVVDGGDGDVAAARFGDATLVVTAGEGNAEGPPAAKLEAGGTPGSTALAAVAALTAELGACADLEAASSAVLAAMARALSPKRAFVLLWDEARGLARPLQGSADDKAGAKTVAVSRTVLELAARKRRALAVEDAVADRVLRDARSVVEHRIRAAVVAPVLAGGRVVGFLHADRDRPAYTGEDAALLECFAAAFALGGHLTAPGTAAGAPASDEPPMGSSAAWQAVVRAAGAAAAATSTVLITGDSGTGKEEIAKYVHRRSGRAGPFVVVNCGAIPEALAESELFGHEKGAFTGAVATRAGCVETADGGTLFLDEVGELPASLQVKLLRVLQERAFSRVGSAIPRRVDLRVVAATHRDLDADVRAGRFREDLFYRLAVIRIRLPPLRERAEDVALLAPALLAKIAAATGRRSPGLEPDAVAALGRWRWPGNVRELGNVVERALVLRPPDAIGPLTAAEILASLGESPGASVAPADAGAAGEGAPLADKVAALERAEIEAALRRARGVKSRAAEALGLSRPTLDKKIADLGIDLWAPGRKDV